MIYDSYNMTHDRIFQTGSTNSLIQLSSPFQVINDSTEYCMSHTYESPCMSHTCWIFESPRSNPVITDNLDLGKIEIRFDSLPELDKINS